MIGLDYIIRIGNTPTILYFDLYYIINLCFFFVFCFLHQSIRFNIFAGSKETEQVKT